MGKKSDALIIALLNHLGIKDLSEINDTHIGKIVDFLKVYPDSDIVKEIIKTYADFLTYARDTITGFNNILSELIKSEAVNVEHLKSIIQQLIVLVDQNNISEKDKDRIFDLIQDFRIMLDKELERIDRRKRMIIIAATGITGVAVFTTTYFVLGKEGARNAAEIAKDAAIQAGKRLEA
jgi:hypothetical protein